MYFQRRVSVFTFLHGGDVADDGNGLGGGEGRGGRHSFRTRERKLSLHCPTINENNNIALPDTFIIGNGRGMRFGP